MSKQELLVIDNGSYEIKAGLSSSKMPSVVFPSVVAAELGVDIKQKKREVFVGKEALKKMKQKGGSKESVYGLRYPIQRGMFTDWEQLEEMYRYVFKSLKLEEGKIPNTVLSVNSGVPSEHKEGLVEMFVELFGADKVAMEVPGYLASKTLKSNHSGNGLVVDIGSGLTTVTPLFNNSCVYSAIRKMCLGGQDISGHLARLMQQYGGYVFDIREESRIAQHVKHNLAYVCLNLNDELQACNENPKQFVQNVELPSGENLSLSRECFLGPEILFDPSLYGCQANASHYLGIHKLLLECANVAAKESSIDEIIKNIYVCGQSALFPNITERLETEIKAFAGKKKKITTTLLSQYATWQGAAVAGLTLTTWISKQEWEEQGQRVVQKKCPF